MCGIFGHIANPDRCSALSSDFLHFVQKRLERRGPDAQNFLEDQNATFFHSRLSFFDLTLVSNSLNNRLYMKNT